MKHTRAKQLQRAAKLKGLSKKIPTGYNSNMKAFTEYLKGAGRELDSNFMWLRVSYYGSPKQYNYYSFKTGSYKQKIRRIK